MAKPPSTTAGTGFQMTGAREVLAYTSAAWHIEKQIISIENLLEDDPSIAIGLAKSLVETVCKGILREKGNPAQGKEDMPALIRSTLQCLQLFHDGADNPHQLNQTLRQTINGLQTTVSGIAALRNLEGASHGKDPQDVPADHVLARLAAGAADSVVLFLFSCHRRDLVVEKPMSYGDDPEFDEHVDEAHDWPVLFETEYHPSEILFHTDRSAYDNYRSEFWSDQDNRE